MVKWLVTILALFAGTAVMAQNVVTTTGPGEFTISIIDDDAGRRYMRYDGAFVSTSGASIINYLENFQDVEHVEFNSPGGHVLEVHGPGGIIRELDLPFIVREGDVCVSACAFLAIYSKDIRLEGLLAFHLPFRPVFSRDETLYDVSQSMVERTMRQTRQMFQNDWLLYLYLTIVRETDGSNFVVFNTSEELNKFRMTDKDQFMDRPEETARIVKMTDQDLVDYVARHAEESVLE